MEAAEQISSSFNWRVFKEPRGFIKLIEWILSIFAFATTTSFTASFGFDVKCTNVTKPTVVQRSFGYPFDLESIGIPVYPCDATNKTQIYIGQGATAPSQFYVFVGVMAFLYCIGGVVLYVFFDDYYRKNTRVVIIDFVASIIVTAFWLIGSSAWAQGVTTVKFYTNPAESDVFNRIPACKATANACTTSYLGNFAGLNVSIIFGFLNFAVWAGNLWFLYKETPWFKVRSKPPSTPGTQSETDPQKV